MLEHKEQDNLISETYSQLKRGRNPMWNHMCLKLSTEDDLDGSHFILEHREPSDAQAPFKTLVDLLPDQYPRWVVVNLPYQLASGREKSKIFLICWVPDTIKRATLKQSATAKTYGIMAMQDLKPRFEEVSFVLQANNKYDLDLSEVLQRCARYESDAIDLETSLERLQ
eukprot:m.228368 g.228368  ORF g.228368 m.228368 type:complete len:169 (-) comp15976_c1_seq38:360-866(-)